MLSGDNSILQKATDAKTETEKGEVYEQISIATASGEMEYYSNGTDRITAYKNALLNGVDGIDKDNLKDNGSNLIIGTVTTKNGKQYDFSVPVPVTDITVDEHKNSLPKLKVGEIDVSTVSDLSTLYGQTTDYRSINHPNIDWQLFYVDDDNYYVIASDYVPNVELPCNGNTGFGETDLLKVDGSDYKTIFCSSSSYNDGVFTAETDYKNGAESNAINNNPLTSTYLKWATTYNTSKNNNICAVSYMMDMSKWQSFADGAGALYAIGGPTIEMLSLSWNEVSDHIQKMTSYDDDNITSNINNKGYVANSPETEDNFFGTSNMWCIRSTTNSTVAGYWLASPLSNFTSYVGIVFSVGRVGGNSPWAGNIGFRPIVVIPK